MSKPLTKEFLIERKVCCGNGCKNCPYIPKHKKGSTEIIKTENKLGELVERSKASD